MSDVTLALECWLPIPGYEGRYEISDHGRVLSFMGKVPRILRPGTNGKKNYLMVFLGNHKKYYVHQLVALCFIGPPGPGQQVRHRDGNQLNNHVSNLIYGTQSDNEYDKVRHGTHQMGSRTHCPHGHEYTEANTMINSKGARVCWTCYNPQACYQKYGRSNRALTSPDSPS